jgi:hypothetical protein
MYTQQQYEKALKRGREEGVTIVGDATYPNGEKVWHVFNPANGEDGWYTCRRAPGRSHLTCNCLAGQHGNPICKHRVVVQESLNETPPGPRRTVGQLRADRMQVTSLWS